MTQDWIVTDRDRELFDLELNSFVPDQIFDAHAHWYRVEDFAADSVPALARSGPAVAGASAFDEAIGQLIPDRPADGLFFPFPHVTMNTDRANQFLYEQLLQRPMSRGQMLITPDLDPELIRETVRRCGFVGLKCYHVYSSRTEV